MLITFTHLRVAARRLVRARAFAAITVVTLALGIGCTAVVFSAINGLLLTSIPYATPERLAVVIPRVPAFCWTVVEQLRDATDVFGGVAVYTRRAANLSGEGQAERSLIGRVSGNFFSITGVRPALGRLFLSEELQPARARVVLLTDATWRRRYGASRDVVGRTLVIDGRAHAIVGVLKPEFRTLEEMQPAREVWLDEHVAVLVPLPGRPNSSPDEMGSDRAANSYGLTIIGRLRDGIPIQRARALVTAITDREIPAGAGRPVFSLQPLTAAVAGDLPRQLAILFAAVVVLLLVACANVTNLMLERFQWRRREMATCAALGASASQLAGSLLAEGILLGGAGGAGGLVIAWAGMRGLKSLLGPMLTRLDGVAVDLRVLAFAAAVSLGTGLLTALIPVIRISRGNTADWLQVQPSAPRKRGRLPGPSLLVVAQVALSVVLVVGGALLAREFARSMSTTLGFRTQGVLTADVSLNPHRYPGTAATAFFDRLLEGAAGLGGVDEAAVVDNVPAGRFGVFSMIEVPGRTPQLTQTRAVSDGYFSLLAIPLVAGRSFRSGDRSQAVVVNEAFARKYWEAARDAVGRQVKSGHLLTIVGVAANAHESGAGAAVEPTLYWDYRTPRYDNTQMTLLLRTHAGNASALANPLRGIVRALDSDQPLYNVMTLGRIAYARFAPQRVMLATMTLFAGVTLLLAAVGVHGVMAYAVALRRREIGVRLALGGSRHAILRLMLARGTHMVAAGLAIGVPAAIAVAWLVRSEMFDIGGTDAVVCLGAAGVVAVGGLIASLSPAIRATRVDPMETLRSE